MVGLESLEEVLAAGVVGSSGFRVMTYGAIDTVLIQRIIDYLELSLADYDEVATLVDAATASKRSEASPRKTS